MFRRSVVRRALASLMIALVVSAPPTAELQAKPALPSKNVDAEVADIAKRAEALLNKLEYERARELLESAVRNGGYRKAHAPSKSRLWALLGRARAEVGDAVGADEAFLQAVMWDRRVRLARGTSPKILEALERARANAPAPGELSEPPISEDAPPAPRREPPDAGQAKAEPPVPEARPDAGKVERPKPDKPDAGRAERPDAGKVDKPEPRKPDKPDKPEPQKPERPDKPEPQRPVKPEKPEPQKQEKPEPQKQDKPEPALGHRIEGQVWHNETVTLVLVPKELPKGVKLELFVRYAQADKFKPEPLVRTGTVATRKLKLDRPRVELYARALKGKKVLATLGSAGDPLVLTPTEKPLRTPPPPIREAWSTPDIRPRLVPTASTASTAVAVAAARTSTRSLVPPPPPPTRVQPAEEDDTLLYVGLAAGGVVVAGGIVLAIVLLSGKSGCDAKEGFGCIEVQVLPLVSF